MSSSVIIVGSGFAGLSAASFMAKAGWKVTVIEKNSGPGGRARQLKKDGFTFDMGPSWYWMPDVFKNYFEKLLIRYEATSFTACSSTFFDSSVLSKNNGTSNGTGVNKL